jgi:hypothetical protein
VLKITPELNAEETPVSQIEKYVRVGAAVSKRTGLAIRYCGRDVMASLKVDVHNFLCSFSYEHQLGWYRESLYYTASTPAGMRLFFNYIQPEWSYKCLKKLTPGNHFPL